MKIVESIKHRITHKRKLNKFISDFKRFKNEEKKTIARFLLEEKDFFACLNDATVNTGFDRHYVYHVAWAIRTVLKINPASHTDISGSLHFCSALSAVIPVDFYDYRPAKLELSGLKTAACDLNKLHFKSNSVESISCLHTIEHIGLGRYGDSIDYDGDLKAMAELKRVVQPGGSLLFVAPVGKPKIVYNAHRIYSYEQICSYFEGFTLREFSLVPDKEQDGGLIVNASKELSDAQSYGCGCFWFVKN
jgi:SAM-dependent methyltransferase